MKKALFILIFLFSSLLCKAQKNLELFYIAHNHFESALADVIKENRQVSRYDKDKVVVFYLANGSNPIWFKASAQDGKDYDAMIEALNSQVSHNVYPEVDRIELIKLFSDKNILGVEGFSSFKSVSFNFYINPSFVTMGYCDSVIGRLFWDMDLASLPKGVLEVNIYHHTDDGYIYKEERLFGRQNLMKGFSVMIDTF